MELGVTTGDTLVVKHLLEHDFLSHVQLESLLEDLGRVPLSEKAPIFNENPPHCGRASRFKGPPHSLRQLWGPQPPRANPYKLHDLPVPKRIADSVLETAKRIVVGGLGGATLFSIWQNLRAMTTP